MASRTPRHSPEPVQAADTPDRTPWTPANRTPRTPASARTTAAAALLAELRPPLRWALTNETRAVLEVRWPELDPSGGQGPVAGDALLDPVRSTPWRHFSGGSSLQISAAAPQVEGAAEIGWPRLCGWFMMRNGEGAGARWHKAWMRARSRSLGARSFLGVALISLTRRLPTTDTRLSCISTPGLDPTRGRPAQPPTVRLHMWPAAY